MIPQLNDNQKADLKKYRDRIFSALRRRNYEGFTNDEINQAIYEACNGDLETYTTETQKAIVDNLIKERDNKNRVLAVPDDVLVTSEVVYNEKEENLSDLNNSAITTTSTSNKESNGKLVFTEEQKQNITFLQSEKLGITLNPVEIKAVASSIKSTFDNRVDFTAMVTGAILSYVERNAQKERDMIIEAKQRIGKIYDNNNEYFRREVKNIHTEIEESNSDFKSLCDELTTIFE